MQFIGEWFPLLVLLNGVQEGNVDFITDSRLITNELSKEEKKTSIEVVSQLFFPYIS